jgi:membrane-bound metal-dependent hydrolase YbcI (DUF457 family)
MPLPLAHVAMGVAAYNLCCGAQSVLRMWKVAIFVSILANLPDIDVVVGLVVQGNGNAFHRGPTHSIGFAVFVGLLASYASGLLPQIPKMSFKMCFLIVLTHLMADFLSTGSPISFFWPLEAHWTAGHSGWMDIINSVFLDALQDVWVIVGCGLIILSKDILIKYSGAFTDSGLKPDKMGSAQ